MHDAGSGNDECHKHRGLYQKRWNVELFIDDLKITLGMAVLKTLSPAMIRYQLLAHIIAYNLLRVLMNQSKSAEAESASFKGTIDRLSTGYRSCSRRPQPNSASGWWLT